MQRGRMPLCRSDGLTLASGGGGFETTWRRGRMVRGHGEGALLTWNLFEGWRRRGCWVLPREWSSLSAEHRPMHKGFSGTSWALGIC